MKLALIDALPDLVVLVQRDGTLLSQAGGQEVQSLRPASGSEGKNLESVWPAAVAELIKRLARRAIAMRTLTEAEFMHDLYRYEARVTPQGPDRAICIIRSALAATRSDMPAIHLDRRGFLRRLKESISVASLNERPF